MSKLSPDNSYYLAQNRLGFSYPPNSARGGVSGEQITLSSGTCVALENRIVWSEERFGERWLARTKFKIENSSGVKFNYYFFVGREEVTLNKNET